jgi:hypothetical protein
MPEYIRPGTVSSTLAVTPAAVEVHNNVRWGKSDMGVEKQSARARQPKSDPDFGPNGLPSNGSGSHR